MNKLPMCILKYIITILPSNDKFNLAITNKKFNKIISFYIRDYHYMVINNYKLVHYNILFLKGPNIYYLLCGGCNKSLLNNTWKMCNSCKKILCTSCTPICDNCFNIVNLCNECGNKSDIIQTCCLDVPLWCDNCIKQCTYCNKIIDGPSQLYKCASCKSDLCYDCEKENYCADEYSGHYI